MLFQFNVSFSSNHRGVPATVLPFTFRFINRIVICALHPLKREILANRSTKLHETFVIRRKLLQLTEKCCSGNFFPVLFTFFDDFFLRASYGFLQLNSRFYFLLSQNLGIATLKKCFINLGNFFNTSNIVEQCL